MSEKLILTPYRSALKSLELATTKSKDDFVRDATIQRFEYTYEMAWKMIKRHLEWSGFGDTSSLSKKDLFREGAKMGLISDAEKWFEFHQARNETSHTYDQNTAEEVYAVALEFSSEAKKLLKELEKHHG